MLWNSNVLKNYLFEFFYTLEEYFRYYNNSILFTSQILFYYLIEICSRYNFLAYIRYCITFGLFLTILYDSAIVHNSKGTHTHTHMCVCVCIYIYMYR